MLWRRLSHWSNPGDRHQPPWSRSADLHRQVRILRPEFLASRGARGVTGRDLRTIAQLAQALQMRLMGHAEPNDGDAQTVAQLLMDD